jgi:hypothetical protein
MKIASAPMVCMPPYVPKPAKPALAQKVTLPMGGTFHYGSGFRTAAPFPAQASHFEPKKVTELVLRFVSSRIAEHFGQKAVVAKDVIWLCFDLKTLTDKMRQADANKQENIGHALNLAGDFCGTLAQLPKLDGAAGVRTAFYFLAEVGGKPYQGNGTFSMDDFMKFVPLKPEENAVEELRSMASEVIEQLQRA